MKKLVLFLITLSLSISCKKPDSETTPVETTTCLIQKISYDDGNYEMYKFDANNRLSETIISVLDNGKVVEIPLKYEYNAAGNLLKTTDIGGWTDNYIYDANGVLTRVDFKDEKGQIDEQFIITMDAQKRITKIITKKDELTGTYEYNGPNGVFSKSEVKWNGKIIDSYVVDSYETDKTKKSYTLAIKGHPFDPSQFTNDIIYGTPFNFVGDNAIVVTGKSLTQWNNDWTDLTDKLRVYYNFTTTRKFNSNNFVIERATKDAIENKSYLKTFSYSNCN